MDSGYAGEVVGRGPALRVEVAARLPSLLPLRDRTIRVTSKPFVVTLAIIRPRSAATASTMDSKSDVDSSLIR